MLVMLRESSELLNYYGDGLVAPDPLCKGNFNRTACDALTFGCIVRGFTKVGLLLRGPAPPEVRSSIRSVRLGLRDMGFQAYPDSGTQSSSLAEHSSCNYCPAFFRIIERIYQVNEPIGLPSTSERHFGDSHGVPLRCFK